MGMYIGIGTAQRRPIGRGSCFYGGECTMERSSSSRNCTREHATWSSVLLGAWKWIQKKKKSTLEYTQQDTQRCLGWPSWAEVETLHTDKHTDVHTIQ
jgi:hypothetical protein